MSQSKDRPLIVDIHGHFVIDELLSRPGATEAWRYERGFDEQGGIVLRRADDRVPCFFEPSEIDAIVANLDHLGIDTMAINIAPFQMGYELDVRTGRRNARVANEAIATAVDAHPLRFVGMGTLPLQDTDAAIAELDWIVGAGMVGVELGSNVGGALSGRSKVPPRVASDRRRWSRCVCPPRERDRRRSLGGVLPRQSDRKPGGDHQVHGRRHLLGSTRRPARSTSLLRPRWRSGFEPGWSLGSRLPQAAQGDGSISPTGRASISSCSTTTTSHIPRALFASSSISSEQTE